MRINMEMFEKTNFLSYFWHNFQYTEQLDIFTDKILTIVIFNWNYFKKPVINIYLNCYHSKEWLTVLFFIFNTLYISVRPMFLLHL